MYDLFQSAFGMQTNMCDRTSQIGACERMVAIFLEKLLQVEPCMTLLTV